MDKTDTPGNVVATQSAGSNYLNEFANRQELGQRVSYFKARKPRRWHSLCRRGHDGVLRGCHRHGLRLPVRLRNASI